MQFLNDQVEHIYKYSKYLAYVDTMPLEEMLELLKPEAPQATPEEKPASEKEDTTADPKKRPQEPKDANKKVATLILAPLIVGVRAVHSVDGVVSPRNKKQHLHLVTEEKPLVIL